MLAAACDNSGQRQAGSTASPLSPAAVAAKGRLQELVRTNATVVGYLYTPDKPYVIASFSNGSLQWRTDRESATVAQGPAVFFSDADEMCVGLEQKKPSMPDHGPERYLVCEAVRAIEHSNSLPRSQDFRLDPGTLFMQYGPPAGTGFIQYFYASRTK